MRTKIRLKRQTGREEKSECACDTQKLAVYSDMAIGQGFFLVYTIQPVSQIYCSPRHFGAEGRARRTIRRPRENPLATDYLIRNSPLTVLRTETSPDLDTVS